MVTLGTEIAKAAATVVCAESGTNGLLVFQVCRSNFQNFSLWHKFENAAAHRPLEWPEWFSLNRCSVQSNSTGTESAWATVLGEASRARLTANQIAVFRSVSRKLLSYRLVSAWGNWTRSRSSSNHTNPQLTRSVAIRAGRIIRPQRLRSWQLLGASSTYR